MPYRIEVSQNARAGCKGACKEKISKDDLRFGTLLKMASHESWTWRHWGCITPKQFSNVRESLTTNDTFEIEKLNGYDELTPELQAKVKSAIENGHVDDEDWRGEPSENRPGAPIKRKKTAKTPNEEGAEETEALEPHIHTPELGSNGDNQAPPEKKKRSRNPTAAAEPEPAEESEPAEETEKTEPAPKKRGRPAKSEERKKDKVPAEPTRARSSRNAGAKKNLKEVDEDEEVDDAPVAKREKKVQKVPKDKAPAKEKVSAKEKTKEKPAPKEKAPKKPTKAELAKAAKEIESSAAPQGEKDAETTDKAAEEKIDKEMVDVIVGADKPEEKVAEPPAEPSEAQPEREAEEKLEEPAKLKGKGGRPKKVASAPKPDEKTEEVEKKAPAGRKRKATVPEEPEKEEEKGAEAEDKAEATAEEPKKKRGRPARAKEPAASEKAAKAPAKKGKAKKTKSASPSSTPAPEEKRKSVFGGSVFGGGEGEAAAE